MTKFSNRVVTVASLKEVRTNKNGTPFLTGSYAINVKNAAPDAQAEFQNFIMSGKTLEKMGDVKVGDLLTISGEDTPKSFTKGDGTPGEALDAKIIFARVLSSKKVETAV